MSGKFKPGDLVALNQYGYFIVDNFYGKVGIIVNGPYSIIVPIETIIDTFYTVYDVLIEEKLFSMIPEEFMEKFKLHEVINRMESWIDEFKKIVWLYK